MRNFLFYLVLFINIIVLIYISIPKKEYINIEIKGSVKYPGVYKVEYGSIVEDVIKKAILDDNSDISVTNMAKKLNDSDVIIIYTKEELLESKKQITAVKYIEKECVCPRLEINTCINKEVIIDNNDSIINDVNKISLNTSTLEELETLPGIGESKALKIIEYRDQNNGFKALEELTNVKGIGNSIYEKIKDLITL